MGLLICLSAATAQGQTIILVDDDAPPAGDGTTWGTAYRFLQDALVAADAIPLPRDVEIHIAQGIYLPDRDELNPTGTADRTATFSVFQNISIFGGYAGFGAVDPDARDVDLFETILSGDLAGDDVMPGFLNMEENSALVLEIFGSTPIPTIDGLTIEGGNSDMISTQGAGARIFGDAIILNCVFQHNFARNTLPGGGSGGAIFLESSDTRIENCLFVENAGSQGGAIFISVGNEDVPVIRNCRFELNISGLASSSGSGSAIFVDRTAGLIVPVSRVLHIDQCVFVGNTINPGVTGSNGGAVVSFRAPIWVSNSQFMANVTPSSGAAISLGDANDLSIPSIIENCVFSGNTSSSGGAVSTTRSDLKLINSTFNLNNAVPFPGLGGGIRINFSSAWISNCVFWGNIDAGSPTTQSQQISFAPDSIVTIASSCVEGWDGTLGGVGNIGLDPLFVDPLGTDGLPGTEDDDLRLSAGSPCIDAGDRQARREGIPDVFDIDSDDDSVEPIPHDFLGGLRIQDDPATPDSGTGGCALPDMGAAEFAGLDPEQVYSYVGPAGGSWSMAANWSGGFVPDCDDHLTLGDVVIINQIGTVAADITISSQGELRLEAGTLTLNTLHLQSGATLTLDDPAAVLSARSIVMDAGSQLNWIAGTIELEIGQWSTSDPIILGQLGTARIKLSRSAVIQAPTITIGTNGDLGGIGTVMGDVDNAGLLSPGTSIGRFEIIGSYTQQPGGRLLIEIQGRIREFDFDFLKVMGAANLGGTLEIDVLGNFEPQAQDTFDLFLESTSRSGTFSTIDAPITTGGLGFDVSYLFNGATLQMFATQSPRVLHVDDDAPPGGDGLSWATAFDDFQSGLADANVGDEVRVAHGLYRPAGPGGDQSDAFEMRSGITWLGGYAGVGAADPDARDPSLFEAILSGDLNGDDLPGFVNYEENSAHVVVAQFVDTTAVMDGFVVEHGKSANDIVLFVAGAGLLVNRGSPTVENCVFRFCDGSASMYLSDFNPSSPLLASLTNCEFSDNRGSCGGALSSSGSYLFTVTNCSFSRNQATSCGGAIVGGNLTITESQFSDNSALYGGALFVGTSTLTNCSFSNNSASFVGGAILVSSPIVTASGLQFLNNSAPEGSSIAVSIQSPLITPEFSISGDAGSGLHSNGVVRPGILGAGRLVIDGDYSNDEIINDVRNVVGHLGALEIDLGGTTPEFGYDVVNITGNFVGRGTLQANFINSFVPFAGDTFEIITAASIVNPFDAALMPGFPDDRFLRVQYSSPASKLLGSATITLVVDSLNILLGFDDPSNFAVSGVPSGAVVGDFDGSNGDDLAVIIPDVNPLNNGDLIILYNAGTDGSGNWLGYGSTSQMPVGREPTGIAAGFFDGDADLDLAVTNGGDNDVSILLNNGDTTFARTDVAVGNAPSDVVSVELTSDFNDDLAVTNAGDDTVSILVNDGFGVFTLLTNIDVDDDAGVQGGPKSLIAADLDGNGTKDLAVVNEQSNEVSVLYGLATGFFLPPIRIPVDPGPTDVDPIDIDNDKDLDLVVVNRTGDSISLLKNDISGTFTNTASLTVGDEPRSLVTGDFDNDGDDDIVIVVNDDLGNAVVKILRNDTNGSETVTLADAEDLAQGEETVLVVAGDVDEDGSRDLITINASVVASSSARSFGASGSAVGAPGSVAVRQNDSGLPCPADTNGNGMVNVTDLLDLLAAWGPCPDPCPPDINNDGNVNVTDLLALLAAWGACP